MRETLPIEFLRTVELKNSLNQQFTCPVFLYVRSGAVEILNGAVTKPISYERTELLLLHSGRKYTLTPSGSGDRLILLLGIEDTFLQDHLDLVAMDSIDSVIDVEHDYLPVKRQFLKLADAAAQSQEQNRNRILGELYLFLYALQKITTPYPMHPSAVQQLASTQDARVPEIANYIDEHYAEPLSLEDVADAFYLTPQYLSAFFKEHFQVGFKTWLTRKRLFYSLRDLRQTSDPISAIASRNGFASVSAYRRNFSEEYGESPLAYRKRYREKVFSKDPFVKEAPSVGTKNGRIARTADDTKVEVFSSGGLASSNTPDSSAASAMPGEPAEILRMGAHLSVDRPAQTLSRTEQILNIGTAANLLTSEFQNQILEYQSVRPTPYVRLMSLVSSSFLPSLLPDYMLSFQNVDTVLSFLYRHQMAPLIELSRQQFYFDFSGDETQQQYYYISRSDRYYARLQAFLQHAAAQWPMSWLSGWKFELWMQPRETAFSYVRDFAKIQALIQESIPGAQLGGPGYHACVTPVSVEALLEEFRAQNVRPDFFSVYLNYHLPAGGKNKDEADAKPVSGKPAAQTGRKAIAAQIAGKGPQTANSVSMDPDYLLHTCERIREKLHSYDAALPLYATEWNSICSEHLPVAYSLYQSAFVVRTLLSLSRICDMTGYWLYADIQNQTRQALVPSLRIFGQGLFTRQFHITPAGYAFAILSRIDIEMLDRGPGYLLTRSGPDRYQLLFYEYQHFLAREDPKLLAAEDYSHFNALFGEHTSVELSYDLRGLRSGLYQLRRTILDSYHGSFLDVLINGYRHSSIDALSYFQFFMNSRNSWLDDRGLFSSPEERIVYMQSDGTLPIRSTITLHSVAVWEIRRQV